VAFAVGNATQTSHYFQSAFVMEQNAYGAPETGNVTTWFRARKWLMPLCRQALVTFIS
jgi:hypothetical protein